MASDTHLLEPRGNTRVNYALPLLVPGRLHSSDCTGAGRLPGASPDVREVKLEITRTSTKYRKELRVAYGTLLRWVSSTKWQGSGWLEDPVSASQVLCEHVQWLKGGNRPISDGRHAILATQTIHRSLKGKLGRPWDCIKSWQLQQPLKSRVPLPAMLMQGFFLYAIAAALAASADYDVHGFFALGILMSWGTTAF